MLIKKKGQPSYIELFLAFFWMGLTAFGGLAMFAHVRRYIADKRKWLVGNNFDSGLALCQVIPGAIIMQLVTYIGLKLKGIRGAVICFIGFGLPAFLIMFVSEQITSCAGFSDCRTGRTSIIKERTWPVRETGQIKNILVFPHCVVFNRIEHIYSLYFCQRVFHLIYSDVKNRSLLIWRRIGFDAYYVPRVGRFIWMVRSLVSFNKIRIPFMQCQLSF